MGAAWERKTFKQATKMKSKLDQVLEALPDAPGVYLHKDAAARVLYIGKAKSLRSRVRSYFQTSAAHTPRIAAMVKQVDDVEVFHTRSYSRLD